MRTQTQYHRYKKPSWAPPSWVFGPVWTFLYILILVSFSAVAYLYVHNLLPFYVLLPFLLNLVSNLLFTPLQFRLRSFVLGTVDIVVVLATLIWSMIAVYPYADWVVYVNIPYLLWVCFATVLQFRVASLNA